MNNPNARSHKEPIDSIKIPKKRTYISNLDPEERELLELYEQGEWVSKLTPERVKELQSYVEVTWEERKRDIRREDEL
ncbi:MAG: hypothetical protein EWV53_19735 [Microcystis panniformis Mp_MB_F_20051200_S9]|jgi:hypothetical protein|uniref:Uncharacterized protein n=1 Tax=Microcystis panniformis Mp_MB_F_20051200_S9 TaxID=2486223 RepID=A0A552PM06_9CHRO|nr:MAG: hypothetical protein EWV43_24335 [Microcystis panniformis Mp_MB_F_20080800_S26D]TRV50030.1 MAG: hypothetical protein EWV42_12005 [Microcystis panniformis Mp_GB_SS_20050300_S99D]TRV53007.1 MAG: hypothetical protein EWV87_03855 [Microcystis panniformis Mp_GB_SS_20050300_S99]TRV57979.1 MAG: hypothetical protein EWV53_19735 [Microcystis panniformis Mp_MB_F_20051200_S9]TRV59042.1 MAG: hypothetical protein EWV86_18470 [Microcystis panniformis Mp_MB_F_20051200_S9D]TRV61678.1 MAG: hypothetical